jgi:hypothetical protein
MADLKLHVPVTGEIAVDAGTRAALDRGIEDADAALRFLSKRPGV